MARIATAAGFGLALVTLGLGCTHMIESRTVRKFAEALEKKDFSTVKTASTEEFNRKALRHAKALDDFQILNLPDGKVTVAKVEDESPTVKNVTVEVGKRKKKLLYKLVKNEKTGEWQVDDIRISQKRRGVTVTEPVTKQMDLLLSVREFLDAWDGGDRDAILKVVTTELGTELGALPAPALAKLAKQLIGDRSKDGKLRPKAELDGAAAIVALPRTNGKMLIAFRLREKKWKVADVSVAPTRGEKKLPSLLKKAVVMRTAHSFLSAYAALNRPKLKRLSTSRFYSESLANADLSLMPLNSPDFAKVDFEVVVERTRASYLVKEPTRWVRVSLIPRDKKTDADSPTEFQVEDVAVHKLGSRQEIRLSSFFTSRVKAALFAQALARKNLKVLEKLSTGDFRNRVWDVVDSRMIRSLPDLGLVDPRLTIETVNFDGAVTEVYGKQGQKDVTYVLRERRGQVHVDDVRLLEFGKAKSLKATIELAIPIRKFARALEKGDIPALQRISSNDFNRLIWKQARVVPRSGLVVPRYLAGPISSVVRSGKNTLVTLGDSRFGAMVTLVSPNRKYLVEEIILIAGPLPSQQGALKKQMRLEMANSALALQKLSPRQRRNLTIISPGKQSDGNRIGIGVTNRDPERGFAGGSQQSGLSNVGQSDSPLDLDLPTRPTGNSNSEISKPPQQHSRVRHVSGRVDPRFRGATKPPVVDVEVDPNGDAFGADSARRSSRRSTRRVIRTSETAPYLPRHQLR